VCGKGGVGRSTVAAAIASATARRGRKTLLFESNANDRFGTFFGTSPVGTDIVKLAPNLHAVNTTPAAALEEYGLMVLRFKRVYKMVFENRVTRYFLRAIPGLDDYAVLGKCWYHATGGKKKPKWDTVVFDMPASGHSLSMLRIPKVILETVPEGPLTRDARDLRQLLLDPDRTGLVLVTLAEEMPANEANELATLMKEQVDLDVAHLVINQIYPDRFPADSPENAILGALESHVAKVADVPTDVANLSAHAGLAHSRRQLNERYITQLYKTVPAPHTLLPYLFAPALGHPEIDTLSELLEESLDS
jgi:anion-transporting  ArsA/GET3 family ATPase